MDYNWQLIQYSCTSMVLFFYVIIGFSIKGPFYKNNNNKNVGRSFYEWNLKL
jgi:hypothetical protein